MQCLQPPPLSALCLRCMIQCPALIGQADRVPPRNRPILLEEIVRHNLFVAIEQLSAESIAVLDQSICDMNTKLNLRLQPGQEVTDGYELSGLFCLRQCVSLLLHCRPFWHSTFSELLAQCQKIESLTIINLNVSNHDFLSYLPTNNLTKLHLEIYSDERLPAPIDFKPILDRNPNLIDFYFYQKLHTEEMDQFCIDLCESACVTKLKTLALRNFRAYSESLGMVLYKCTALEEVSFNGLFQLNLKDCISAASWRSCRLGFSSIGPDYVTMAHLSKLPKTIEHLSCDFWFTSDLQEEIFVFENVKSLQLKYRNFKDQFFAAIFDRMGAKLEEIDFGYVNDTDFTNAAFESLVSPYLSAVPSQSASSSQSAPAIRKLSISVDQPNQKSSGQPLVAYFQNKYLASKIEILNLYGFTDLCHELLTAIVNNCPNLQQLSISSKYMTDDLLIKLAVNSPKLFDCNLSNCVSLTEQGLWQFAILAKNIECLDLAHCLNVSQECRQRLQQSRQSPLTLLMYEQTIMDRWVQFYRSHAPPSL